MNDVARSAESRAAAFENPNGTPQQDAQADLIAEMRQQINELKMQLNEANGRIDEAHWEIRRLQGQRNRIVQEVEHVKTCVRNALTQLGVYLNF